MNHPLCMHRHLAVDTLRCFSSESFLGDCISSAQCSEVMVKMCQFILMGPALFVQQMGDPTTTWQSCMCFGNNNVFLALILLLQFFFFFFFFF
jgi:hypothetical protein